MEEARFGRRRRRGHDDRAESTSSLRDGRSDALLVRDAFSGPGQRPSPALRTSAYFPNPARTPQYDDVAPRNTGGAQPIRCRASGASSSFLATRPTRSGPVRQDACLKKWDGIFAAVSRKGPARPRLLRKTVRRARFPAGRRLTRAAGGRGHLRLPPGLQFLALIQLLTRHEYGEYKITI